MLLNRYKTNKIYVCEPLLTYTFLSTIGTVPYFVPDKSSDRFPDKDVVLLLPE